MLIRLAPLRFVASGGATTTADHYIVGDTNYIWRRDAVAQEDAATQPVVKETRPRPGRRPGPAHLCRARRVGTNRRGARDVNDPNPAARDPARPPTDDQPAGG